MPCHNEGDNAREVFAALDAVDYPDFEIVGINDGSRDNTGEILDELDRPDSPTLRRARSRISRETAWQALAGATPRATACVAIDRESLPSTSGRCSSPLPRRSAWFGAADRNGTLVALTGTSASAPHVPGSPASRPSSGYQRRLADDLAARRSSTVFARRRLRLPQARACSAGWWSPATLTDDVDITWRIQMAGWSVAYEPKALCWILMPETLGGLWRQRLRMVGGRHADGLPLDADLRRGCSMLVRLTISERGIVGLN